MGKLRLNIGALTVSDVNGGSYSFLLRRDKSGKFLNIKLNRSDANAIVAVLGYRRGVPPLQMVFSSNIQNFGVRLAEVNIIVIGRKREYAAELVFQSAETESRSVATFADGIALARLCNAPLLIDEFLFEKLAVKTGPEEKNVHSAMKEALDNENYELAADLEEEMKKFIEDLKGAIVEGVKEKLEKKNRKGKEKRDLKSEDGGGKKKSASGKKKKVEASAEAGDSAKKKTRGVASGAGDSPKEKSISKKRKPKNNGNEK